MQKRRRSGDASCAQPGFDHACCASRCGSRAARGRRVERDRSRDAGCGPLRAGSRLPGAREPPALSPRPHVLVARRIDGVRKHPVPGSAPDRPGRPPPLGELIRHAGRRPASLGSRHGDADRCARHAARPDAARDPARPRAAAEPRRRSRPALHAPPPGCARQLPPRARIELRPARLVLPASGARCGREVGDRSTVGDRRGMGVALRGVRRRHRRAARMDGAGDGRAAGRRQLARGLRPRLRRRGRRSAALGHGCACAEPGSRHGLGTQLRGRVRIRPPRRAIAGSACAAVRPVSLAAIQRGRLRRSRPQRDRVPEHRLPGLGQPRLRDGSRGAPISGSIRSSGTTRRAIPGWTSRWRLGR
jgi:hypothetical protein